jgi:four helix bundle protein
MTEAQPEDIKARTFRFALQILALVEKLPNTISATTIGKQLVRSGISIGASVEEATAAHSKSDFVYRMNISLREARETLYWLRLLEASKILPSADLAGALKEADELTRILGAIVSSARGKRKT